MGRNTSVSLLEPNIKGVPGVVMGDSDRLRGILLNLYTNAAKFTKQGFIGLRVRVVDSQYQPSPPAEPAISKQKAASPRSTSGKAEAELSSSSFSRRQPALASVDEDRKFSGSDNREAVARILQASLKGPPREGRPSTDLTGAIEAVSQFQSDHSTPSAPATAPDLTSASPSSRGMSSYSSFYAPTTGSRQSGSSASSAPSSGALRHPRICRNRNSISAVTLISWLPWSDHPQHCEIMKEVALQVSTRFHESCALTARREVRCYTWIVAVECIPIDLPMPSAQS